VAEVAVIFDEIGCIDNESFACAERGPSKPCRAANRPRFDSHFGSSVSEVLRGRRVHGTLGSVVTCKHLLPTALCHAASTHRVPHTYAARGGDGDIFKTFM
jgi:hypothetical protein